MRSPAAGLGTGILIALMLSAPPAPAQPAAPPYALDWRTLDGGGAIESHDASLLYRLGGTVGQPDAGKLAGGLYVLRGGFWSGLTFLEPLEVPPLVPVGLPTRFRALPPWPNPSRGGVTFALDLPDAREVRVSVFDVSGHLVRALARERRGPGRQVFAWDGRDGLGRPVRHGLFFVHVDAGRDRGVSKVVLLDPPGGAR